MDHYYIQYAINERLDELKKKYPNTRSYGHKITARRFEDYLNLIDAVVEAIFTISGKSQLNYMMAVLENRYWVKMKRSAAAVTGPRPLTGAS